MHTLDMPTGSTIRLMATARALVAGHRWEVRVLADGGAPRTARLAYSSRIGGDDREQRIDIPAQDMDCRLEVRSRHAMGNGDWQDDKLTIIHDAPGRLDLGFSDPSRLTAHENDVLLSFIVADRTSRQT